MALEEFYGIRDRLFRRYGKAQVNAVAWIALVGLASISVRLLMHYEFDKSALLYVGIPYAISLLIALYRPVGSEEKWWHPYADHSLIALSVFLASSIVLFEGFICVVFFLPIYFLAISVAFFVRWARVSRERKHGKTYAFALPILILATSLEGTSPALTMSRDSYVEVTTLTTQRSDQIMDNLARPFDLQKNRHVVRTRYNRWFVTNTHEGEMHLQIVEVKPNKVRTKFLHDSTFFSSYLTPVGTEITLTELPTGQTEVALRIDYRRDLDPAWYFHPLQQYGVSKMAEFLIDEVMLREQQ